MSPLFFSTENRGPLALGDPALRREVANRMFTLASAIEDFLAERYEELDCGECDDLREHATKLLAYANLIITARPEELLAEEIELATENLSRVTHRAGG